MPVETHGSDLRPPPGPGGPIAAALASGVADSAAARLQQLPAAATVYPAGGIVQWGRAALIAIEIVVGQRRIGMADHSSAVIVQPCGVCSSVITRLGS
jgi:hypothetical protein